MVVGRPDCALQTLVSIFLDIFRYHPRITKYREQIIYLDSDDVDIHHCRNNGSIITLEEGQRSAAVIRLGRVHHHREPFLCSIQVRKGARYEMSICDSEENRKKLALYHFKKGMICQF
jgi:hypothetical protein